MREIKFRAWEKNHKEMLEVLGIFFDVQTIKHKNLKIRGNTNPFNDGYPNTNFCDIELMQFTGLLDKNGKEVYEGDIVTILSNGYPKEVKWEPRYCGFNIRPNRRNAKGYEVIGNIYENPELLGGKK